MTPSFVILISSLMLLSIIQIASGYSNSNIVSRAIAARKITSVNAGSDSPPLDDRTRERIDKLVNGNKVLLFMKGNKLFPQW